MAIVKTEITPPFIPNTIMRKAEVDGVLRRYEIEPINDDYVVHDKRLDSPIYDDEMPEEVIGYELGFAQGTLSVRFDYDFNTVIQDTITDSNGNTITVNKIGQYELYAIPRNNRPPDSYISGSDEEHEIM